MFIRIWLTAALASSAACSLAGAAAPHKYVAIHCGTLLDVRTGHGIRDAMVLVEDGKIRDSGAASRVRLLHNEKAIDLTQATCLPGLIDGHQWQVRFHNDTIAAHGT